MKIIKLHIKLYTLSIGYILFIYFFWIYFIYLSTTKPKKKKIKNKISKNTVYTSKEQKELVLVAHLYRYNRKTEVSLNPI